MKILLPGWQKFLLMEECVVASTADLEWKIFSQFLFGCHNLQTFPHALNFTWHYPRFKILLIIIFRYFWSFAIWYFSRKHLCLIVNEKITAVLLEKVSFLYPEHMATIVTVSKRSIDWNCTENKKFLSFT